MYQHRQELSDALNDLYSTDDVNIYYRPDDSLALEYPCVVYTMTQLPTIHSNNKLYSRSETYRLSFISELPGDVLAHKLAELEGSFMRNEFVRDNLVNSIFEITIGTS